MSKYSNLPGVNIELLDGNLRVDEPIDERAVLLVGTALTGSTNVQYVSRDSNKAANIYGASSTLIKRMEQIKLGGAKTVILYRIGGKAARIDGIFGEGSYIETVEESVSAGENYSIYIGERPSKDGKSCLIIFDGSRIVFSNVPGSEVNRSMFNVVGFDENTAVRVGTPTEPVKMSQVILAVEEKVFTQDNASGTNFSLPNTRKAYAVEITGVKVDGKEVQTTNVSVADSDTADEKVAKFANGQPENQSLEITYTVKPVRTEEGSVLLTGDGTTNEFDLPKTSFTDTVVIKSVYVAGVDKTSTTTSGNGTNGKKVTLAEAIETGKIGVVDYVIYKTAEKVEGTYQAGEDNVTTTWKKYYELIHAALLSIDISNAFAVVTDKAILDVPNVAKGDTVADRLDYVYIYEVAGELKYEWSADKVIYYTGKGTGKTADVSKADIDGNGQPRIYRTYNEADFAHLIALFCHNISENEKFCIGVIGTSTPSSFTNQEVLKWIGTPPTYDIQGRITDNGTGLLGVRNMVERLEARQGYYLTTSGFVDGSVEFDSNNAPIDIGKYLSVVPAIINTGISSAYSTDGRNTNAAALYAGLLTTINPGDSTTNISVSRITLPFEVKKSKLNELAGAGYVMMQTKTRGVTVVSGELASSINSDYDYVSTSIAVSDVVSSIREVVEPFIGKGTTQAMVSSINTAVESVLQTKVNQGVVNKYNYSIIPYVTSTGNSTIDIPLILVPAHELREVNVSVKLAFDL